MNQLTQSLFGQKTVTGRALLVAGMVSVLALSGCSKDESETYSSESGAGVSAPAPSQPSAADVKQPVQAEPAPQVAEPADAQEIKEAVDERLDAIKQQAEDGAQQQVEEQAAAAVSTAKSGSGIYATCVGCHGGSGEGGVGPKLAGQSKDALVDKLTRYKAGEQIGPMTAMMQPIVSGLSEDDIQAVAEYITTL
ncbi:c-type cytochrome [Thiomicrorhabdus sp. zzn3]|uniref:c-type cytochrome n=1 Tax=Thiomicrorhabdus sp. zzn3 TaxID=3039775 RepID=UPI0024373B3D|nr:c-type cytochrome [Thiomicrorhabdus sp. zzn3]MDG6778161.1 c-type cytochrome [Thiomicrorhabdus sp. zzn3]